MNLFDAIKKSYVHNHNVVLKRLLWNNNKGIYIKEICKKIIFFEYNGEYSNNPYHLNKFDIDANDWEIKT